MNTALDLLAAIVDLHPKVLTALLLLPLLPIVAHYAQADRDTETWAPTHVTDEVA